MRVLIVCHANVTRSVAAAHLLSEATEGRATRLEVRTAGTHAHEGQPVSFRTRDALAAATGTEPDLRAYRSHQLDDDDVEWADVVVVMEGSQVRLLRQLHPAAAHKVAAISVLARELPDDDRPFAARLSSMDLTSRGVDDADDVGDPAGGDHAAYVHAMTTLVDLCASLAERLGTDSGR